MPERVVGIGIDVLEVRKLRAMLRRHGERIRDLFTDAELAHCDRLRRRAESLAARFAAKEAALKALGCLSGFFLDWREIEIRSDGTSIPTLVFRGEAARAIRRRDVARSLLSMSHCREWAVAQVLLIASTSHTPRQERS
jgi:holo-[acyl-carrier protein] synthase